MVEPVGFLIVSLFALGMAIAFFSADPRSPTSRALSLLWLLIGIGFFLNIPFSATDARDPSLVSVWQRVYSVLDAAMLASAAEWVLRIGRMEAPSKNGRAAEWWLRAAQAAAVAYGLVGLALPLRRNEIWTTIRQLRHVSQPEFYLFAVPYDLVFLILAIRLVQLLRGQLDSAEKVRLLAMLVAGPFLGILIALPREWAPLCAAFAEVIFLVGAIRYHVLQGQRGQFLARFLSPQLAKLVRERGLASTMQRSRVEISVVACDLRGFTAFAETAAPEEVMKLLDDYYGAVGEAVTEHGGSIKDFAGDGILALVGAPIALSDHADRALRMALEVRERVAAILSRWKELGLELGLGIGVASGFVTVGTVGGRGRLEYAAVGPVVNLASRLCSRAAAGEILADQRVIGLAGSGPGGIRFVKLETAELKGFARPVAIFTVEPVRDVEKGDLGREVGGA